MERPKAGGIIQNLNLAKIGVMSLPDRPGIAGIVLNTLSEKNVNVQFISHTSDINSRANIIICINMDDLDKSRSAMESIKDKVEAKEIVYQENVAMVSVYGPHFKDQPGIAALAFSALASVGVNILAISTSISTISCLIEGEKISKAIDALKTAFNVSSSSVFTASDGLSLRNR